MATRAKLVTRVPWAGDRDVHIVTWAGLLNGDDGDPVDMPGSADRSIQLVGTLGAGGNCKLEGSNDGTNWVTLTDPQGNALDINTLKVEQIEELTRYIRPRVSAGDGTTSLTAIALVRRTKG